MAYELLAEGTWPCVVVSAEVGENDKNLIVARVNVKIDDGPSKGRACTYEDTVNAKSALYIRRSLVAVGWRGQDMATVKADCAAWIAKTGGKSTVQIKHLEIKNGKRAGEIWDKPNAIGSGPKPLSAPGGALSDANEAMRKAAADDGGAPPEDDVPHPAATSATGKPLGEDEIPFATCSRVGLGEIARVLR
jgi:hypothetical protein